MVASACTGHCITLPNSENTHCAKNSDPIKISVRYWCMAATGAVRSCFWLENISNMVFFSIINKLCTFLTIWKYPFWKLSRIQLLNYSFSFSNNWDFFFFCSKQICRDYGLITAFGLWSLFVMIYSENGNFCFGFFFSILIANFIHLYRKVNLNGIVCNKKKSFVRNHVATKCYDYSFFKQYFVVYRKMVNSLIIIK